MALTCNYYCSCASERLCIIYSGGMARVTLLVLLVCIAWIAVLISIVFFSKCIVETRALSMMAKSVAVNGPIQMNYFDTHSNTAGDDVTRSLKLFAQPNFTPVSVSKMVRVTQSDNLQLRGKWQRNQVTRYCRKYGLQDQLYVLPRMYEERRVLFRHLIYDDRKRFIFCFLPKVGCTNLRRLIFVMQGAIPLSSITWSKVSERKYLRPAIHNASFLNTELTNDLKLYKLKKYFKFVMIRNPLERLVSAYRDKIAPPLEIGDHDLESDPLVYRLSNVRYMDLFQAHRRLILSKYKSQRLKDWARNNGSYKLIVDFTTYIRWIVDTRDLNLNEHFSSMLFNAAPCRVHYDLYLNFKNYSREVRLLIRKLNTSSEYFIDHNSHGNPQDETHRTLPYYYSLLSDQLKRELFARIRIELDFYYHLYPEEMLSHVELLGVHKALAKPDEYGLGQVVEDYH